MFIYQQDNIGYKAEEISTVIKSTNAFHCIETLYLKNCWYKHDTGFDNGFKMLCESCSCLHTFQKPVTAKLIHPQFQINRLQKDKSCFSPYFFLLSELSQGGIQISASSAPKWLFSNGL